jgi:hypothetical protein
VSDPEFVNDADKVEGAEDLFAGVSLSYGGEVDAPAWADLNERDIIHGAFARAAFMPNMTKAGKPTVEMLIITEDGDIVHTSLTWALFGSMAKLFTQWEKRET